MDKNWTKEFKDKMQDYQEIAPNGLWSDISEAMNLTSKQKKPILPIFFRYTGAIAAAAAIILGVLFYWNGSDVNIVDNQEYIANSVINENDISNKNSTEKDIIDTSIGKKSPIKIIPSDEKIYAETTTIEKITPTTENSQENKPIESILHQKDINTSQTPNKPENSEISGNSSETDNKFIETDNKFIESDIFGYIDETDITKRRKFDIGATVSGSIGNMTSQAGYATTVDAANITSFGSHPENEIRMFNRNKEVSSSTKYIQPIKVGIHFKGHISKKWSIGTGIEWTWLHSSLKEGSENYYTSSTSDMHYIGIPLNINFDIWQGRNLNVYTFAGGAMEKCISGKNSVHYVFNNSAAKTESEKFMERQLQWSVSAGVGLEYNFAKFAGIFASPTISWHFDNSSGINNIYKARPLNFSLSLGVRFYL